MNTNEKIIQCPHCQEFIIIQELNCKIFRHGTYKNTGEQIQPHSSKEVCDELFINGRIYGCGKPFRIIVLEDNSVNGPIWKVEICDYI